MITTKKLKRLYVIATACLATTVGAETFSYPVQEFRIGIGNTNRNVVITGSESGDDLGSATISGQRNEKWFLNFISAGVYEIVNSETGFLITNQNGIAETAIDANAANQRWKIAAVEKDFEGCDLYYKIVSNENSNLALTFNPASNSFSTSTYTGTIYQKYKLNLDGLEGYAANSRIGSKEKAGTIGGLLGATEFVSSVEQLVTALNKTEPLTVVVTTDLDMVNQSNSKQRIRDNKTLVGSYSKNTIYDCQLRNDDFNGQDATPSNNIIIRNLNLVARTLNSTGSGVILLYIYGGRNIWVDHNNFSATFAQNSSVEVGKFIWINTPVANWSDGAYNLINPDYITISYNYFKNRYWTVAFGSQNKDTSRLRTSLMFNKWEQCSRRTPQYSNGFHHNYSEYHTVTGSSNPNASSQIIAGEGSRVLSENCRFEAYTGKEIDIDRKLALSYFDNNSYTATTPSATPSKISITTLGSAWKASDSYSYTLVAGYNANGKDTKAFTNAYSGCFKSYAQIKYITDADLTGYVSTKYESPFLQNIEVGSQKQGAIIDTVHQYRLKNVNSNLFLTATPGEIAQQRNALQTWILTQDTDGYYAFYTDISDGKKYILDVQGGVSANGSSLDILPNAITEARLFKLIDNGDGTYSITTKLTKDKSCLGVAAASKTEGASIVEWECNGTADQKWTLNIHIAPISGTLIQNLIVTDTANYRDWKIATKISTGSLVFGDRDVTYSTLPDELVGAEAIQTACDSKNRTSELATFVAGGEITVYVALDSRIPSIPAWLSSWKKTNLTVTNSNGVTFQVFQQQYHANDTVTLGPNGQSTNVVNYTVFGTKNTSIVRNQASIYPNSFPIVATLESHRLHVTNRTNQPALITVYNVVGQRMCEVHVGQISEDAIPFIQPLMKGPYFIRIKGKSFHTTVQTQIH